MKTFIALFVRPSTLYGYHKVQPLLMHIILTFRLLTYENVIPRQSRKPRVIALSTLPVTHCHTAARSTGSRSAVGVRAAVNTVARGVDDRDDVPCSV